MTAPFQRQPERGSLSAPLPAGRVSLFDVINLTLKEFVEATRRLSREWQIARALQKKIQMELFLQNM